MEPKNLKRKEKPGSSSSPLQRSEQHTSHVLMQDEAIPDGVLNGNNKSDQFSSSDMNRLLDISQFSAAPNTIIDLNSSGSDSDELPQQHCHDQMLAKNMNDAHVEGLPGNSVRDRTSDGLHMIRHGGVGNRRNIIAKPRLRPTLSDLAACEAYVKEQNYGSSNLTFDAFQPNYGVDDINDRHETFDALGIGLTINSGSAAIESNTCFQTANEPFMGSINPPIRSPSSSLQHSQLGHQYHPSFLSDMNFSFDVANSNSSNSVNIDHQGFFNTCTSNPEFGRNCPKNLSMTSLLGEHNSELASLQENQGSGSGYNQLRPLDSQGLQQRNLSMTDSNRHKTQQAFEQQCNEAVLLGSSSAEPSLIRNSGAVVDQSSQRFHGTYLRSRTTTTASRAQPPSRVTQPPTQQSEFATTIDPLRPLAGRGPHYSAVPRLPPPVPAFPRPVHARVPTLSHRDEPTLPAESKNVHNPSSSQPNPSTDHIKRKAFQPLGHRNSIFGVSNVIQPLGQDCFLCQRDFCEDPLSKKPTNRPIVAVLPCGHAFHGECLQRITPPEQCKNPPCMLCAIDKGQL